MQLDWIYKHKVRCKTIVRKYYDLFDIENWKYTIGMHQQHKTHKT